MPNLAKLRPLFFLLQIARSELSGAYDIDQNSMGKTGCQNVRHLDKPFHAAAPLHVPNRRSSEERKQITKAEEARNDDKKEVMDSRDSLS